MELSSLTSGFSQNSSSTSLESKSPKSMSVESTRQDIQKQNEPQVQKQKPNKQDLIDIVQELNNDVAINDKLKFGFHDESETFFVSVLDAKTDEVIRKYPTEEAMSLAAKMRELSGGLIDTQG